MASLTDRVSAQLSVTASTVASMIKVALKSKRMHYVPRVLHESELVILGNGPSLNDTINNSRDFLESKQLLAVNFAANTYIFTDLKPQYYVLADPFFFNADNDRVNELVSHFVNDVTWGMTLYVPFATRKNMKWQSQLSQNKNITIEWFNLTPVEGAAWFTQFIYDRGLGMPRPRNVLIPGIMLGIYAGFKTIYIAGADHSWTKTISVNSRNEVVSIQPHFYKEKESEIQRVNTEYLKYPLHQILNSFYVAFRSYHLIENYAKRKGVDIYNITPDSFIDAFRRKTV